MVDLLVRARRKTPGLEGLVRDVVHAALEEAADVIEGRVREFIRENKKRLPKSEKKEDSLVVDADFVDLENKQLTEPKSTRPDEPRV
jgi:hypothetical protein